MLCDPTQAARLEGWLEELSMDVDHRLEAPDKRVDAVSR